MDCDDSVLAVLRTVTAHSYVEWPTLTGDEITAAIAAGMLVATPLPGETADLRRHESVPYSLQSFASSRKAARDLTKAALLALDAECGRSLNFVAASVVPAPVPTERDGAWSFEATVTASVRARA